MRALGDRLSGWDRHSATIGLSLKKSWGCASMAFRAIAFASSSPLSFAIWYMLPTNFGVNNFLASKSRYPALMRDQSNEVFLKKSWRSYWYTTVANHRYIPSPN